VRKAEDRIRELQREVVAKEDQRAAMARHAEALEHQTVIELRVELAAAERIVEGGDLAYVEERVDADGGLIPHLSARLTRHVG
jgi:hypothetical protein